MSDSALSAGNSASLGSWVQLDVSSVSLALLVLGVYVCLVGQLSYWIKERLFMSSALVCICLGIAVGPIGLNWLSPWKWTDYNVSEMNELTYQLCRIVIGVQVMFAGISLPAAYLQKEWKSLFILLGPIMTIAWFVSAGLIVAFVPSLTFLEALCISACVTPTDPILANAIVKGRYAEAHVPHNVRNIISAESGANDGLGYPFIFLPILLMRRGDNSIAQALQHWVVQIWIYDIALACALGTLIGYVARKTLKEAHKRRLVDHESFLSYGIGLAFLTLGVAGVLGTDDVLTAFIAGNSLTWKDFYRVESVDDTFQDVIDSLLNASIFIYLGTLLPWQDFGDASIPLSPWKLVLLSITILIVRRVPWVMLLYPATPALQNKKQALFAGWFGPIGVSAVYYAMVAARELPASRDHLIKVIGPVVLFIAFSSTLAHGITIPLTKFTPLAITHTRSFSSYVGSSSGKLIKRFRTSDVTAPLPRTHPSTLSARSSISDDGGFGGRALSIIEAPAPAIELVQPPGGKTEIGDEDIKELEEGGGIPRDLEGEEMSNGGEVTTAPATGILRQYGSPTGSDVALAVAHKVQFGPAPTLSSI